MKTRPGNLVGATPDPMVAPGTKGILNDSLNDKGTTRPAPNGVAKILHFVHNVKS